MGILYPDHPMPQYGALALYHVQLERAHCREQHMTERRANPRKYSPRNTRQDFQDHRIDAAMTDSASREQDPMEYASATMSSDKVRRRMDERWRHERARGGSMSLWDDSSFVQSDIRRPEHTKTIDQPGFAAETDIEEELNLHSKQFIPERNMGNSPRYSSRTRPQLLEDPHVDQRPLRRDRSPRRHRTKAANAQGVSLESHMRQKDCNRASRSCKEDSREYYGDPGHPSLDRLSATSKSPKSPFRSSMVSSGESERFESSNLEETGTMKRSVWDEVEFYKREHMPEEFQNPPRRCCTGWSRRKKWIICGSLASLALITVLIITAIVLSRRSHNPALSTTEVTNPQAFATGGATHSSPSDVKDGVGAGMDVYRYYAGNASNFPPSSDWVSFEDMWNNNLKTLQNSCQWLHEGQNNSPEIIEDIYNGIQNRANASLVDHRIILAIILQESSGCVYAGSTTSSGGVNNPGLMQSHNGHSYDPSQSSLSILEMIQDGTQGTQYGDGLVQYLNQFGNPYDAARGYNSGHISKSGNLSAAAGATACYVSDMANRLTGWVNAPSTCPDGSA